MLAFKSRVAISSNCTFMELKFVRDTYVLVTDTGSNCTFMELK